MAELVSEPDFYYRKSLWSDEPMMYLAAMDPEENSEWADIEPHWNWEDYQGQEIEVVAYSNVESVELFLDDKSLGTRNLSETDYHALRWNIPYETGTLRAVAQNDGKEVATYEMTTAGEPYQIQLNPNRSKISANGKDISSVRVLVTDRNGVIASRC